jgi:hypothetical protein
MSENPDGILGHSQNHTDPEPLALPADSAVVLAHIVAEALREIAENYHDHRWDIIGVAYPKAPIGASHPRFVLSGEITRALLKCRVCGMLEVLELSGNWTPEQILGTAPEPQ